MSIFINKHVTKLKQNPIVTSTPIKQIKSQSQSPFLEWPSPLDQRSKEPLSPNLPTKKSLNTAESLGEMTSFRRVIASTDKIRLVNRKPEPCDEPEAFVAVKPVVKVKTSEVRPITMDSNEEEQFWKNRNSDTKKTRNGNRKRSLSQTQTQRDIETKKIAKKSDPVTPVHNSEASDLESIYNGRILPKISADPKKAVISTLKSMEKTQNVMTLPKSLHVEKKETVASKGSVKRPRKLEKDVSPEDSDASDNILERLKNRREIERKDEENTVRRSNRKRCKPLEFWNGERMQIERDFTSGISRLKNGKQNASNKKAQNSEKTESIDQSEATGLQNSPSKDVRREKSILKSQEKPATKASVRFSTAIGTDLESDTPATEKSENMDWLKNFDQLHSKKKLKPDSDNCVVLPGLSTAGGSVSSSVIQIRPRSTKISRAPRSHTLVFCLMTSAVAVTIGNTRAQIAKYGHFAAPSGVSYRIENIGKYTAVLSSFKVACDSS